MTPFEFKQYYSDLVKFAGLTDQVIQRAIDWVECTWSGFCCYPESKRQLMYYLAIAHSLEVTGACVDSSAPWFNPATTEVKSYNDTIKFADNDGDLEMSVYGRQLKKLFSQSTTPILYFSGNSPLGITQGGCGV